MYLGRLVEQGSKDQLYRYPHHPYTASLLAAVPVADPVIARTRTAAVLEGDVPSPLNPPTGCHFHPRCPRAQERCSVEAPTQRLVAVGHNVACHHPLDDWPEHTAHQARSSGGSRPMES
jgi:oligopeptide/dipeptide ABC transporter ATP-binding protein